jgi:CarD family transcriptional regulator
MTEHENFFKENDYCVYKTHGVGRIQEIQTIKIGNCESKYYVIFFEKEKLTISIPVNQVSNGYLRKISSKKDIENVFAILKNGTKKVKGMWSRRAKEYEEKINSGDILLTAEVLRDLARDIEDTERSFSERIIYETAVYRLASEYAIIAKIDFIKAQAKILETSKEKINFIDMSEDDGIREGTNG